MTATTYLRSFATALLLAAGLSGCELAVRFDRTKINAMDGSVLSDAGEGGVDGQISPNDAAIETGDGSSDAAADATADAM